jgi:hypothetical protein
MEQASQVFADRVLASQINKAEIMAAAEMGWPEDHDGPAFHCPGRESMEIFAVHLLKNTAKIVEITSKKMISEIFEWQNVAMMILLIALAITSQQMQMMVQILVMIGIFLLLFQTLKMQIQINASSMSQMGVLSRLEFTDACLGGMKIQRLLQICDKMTIIERRMMSQMAEWGDFSRIFRSEILELDWRSADAGVEQAMRMITHFLQIKKFYNPHADPVTLHAAFTTKIMEVINEAREVIPTAGYEDPTAADAFMDRLGTEIQQVWDVARFQRDFPEI